MTGCPFLGVSPDSALLLPRSLIQAADLRLTLPRLDSAVLRQVGRILTGRTPHVAIAADWVTAVSPNLLRLARRSGQTGDAWLERLQRLVAARVPPPPAITLAQLEGTDTVVMWGEALARDVANYRAGRIGWDAVDQGVLMAGPPGVGKTTAAEKLVRGAHRQARQAGRPLTPDDLSSRRRKPAGTWKPAACQHPWGQ